MLDPKIQLDSLTDTQTVTPVFTAILQGIATYEPAHVMTKHK